MLNVLNIPAVTQIRPNMEIVGKIDVQEVIRETKDPDGE